MALKGKEEVILVRPGALDRYGDPTGEATTLGIFEQCVLWPRVSTEVAKEGTAITEGYNVWIPWTAANAATIDEAMGILGTDRVIARGEEWQVEGSPADQRTIKAKRLGVQMVTKRVV